MSSLPDRFRPVLVPVAAGGLVAGLVLWGQGLGPAAAQVWSLAALVTLAALLIEIVGSLRRGDFGLDIVAALSMTAALVFSEALAANVVALMYAGGQYLERFAERRARREMTALLAQAPRTALRHHDGRVEEIPIEAIAPGDRLLVQHGAVVPTDGAIEAEALLDQSALTGEPLPVRHPPGAEVMSGALNQGPAFDLVALRPAEQSTFARIVRLVAEAQAAKAPMVRLADRYAVAFLVLTVALAGAAWGLSGDPIRAVAVLVVATPCPLILAVPVALVAGLSRAASQGVLIKGGGALEAMARASVLVIDKTGTLTEGRPRLLRTETAPGFDAREVLRLAASLDQASQHPVARAVVAEARASGLAPTLPEQVAEVAGEGMEGVLDGRAIRIGHRRFVAPQPCASMATQKSLGEATVAVAVDGRFAGELVLADAPRPEAREVLDRLRAEGIRRVALATGDHAAVARAVAEPMGLDAIHADLTPETKVEIVRRERAHGPVMMVGDGVNDAPALAAADLGVAMGARGSAASAEAADVVILLDRLDPLLAGLRISHRALRIARQSVLAGLGLSAAGMVAAALGYLAPVEGALLQEVIDVAVILNALRVLRPGHDAA